MKTIAAAPDPTFPFLAGNGKVRQAAPHNVVRLHPTAGTTPSTVNGKVTPPRRVPNRERRSREHLTPDEVERLIAAAGKLGRHGHRDATALLLAFRHGLRVGELVSLRWDQVNLSQGLVHLVRLKNGSASVHPLRGPEIRALRRLKRESETSPYVFVTERGGPLTTATVRKLVARAGKEAGLGHAVHPHQLRHSCGYALANRGVDTRALGHYLGHRSLANTMIYTAMAPDRFKNFWND